MRLLAFICFFFSGASGLIFEVIWTRMFSLVFGATTLAISTVLTAFMGGLALGSFLSGRLADRIKDPLKIYALAEAGVGLSALLVPMAVSTFVPLNQFLYEHFQHNYFLLSAIRFVASAAVLLVPTTLMGATLPLLSRLFIQTQSELDRVGRRVGNLYAVNTFGALLGTFLGGFVLLPELGLSLTNCLAASTNILLALVVAIAYQIRRRLPAREVLDPAIASLLDEMAISPAVKPHVSDRARTASLVAFACSGAVAMVYQVIWSRALAMNIGSSVYSFTLVLMAFLVGLAGGACFTSRFASRTKNPVGWLALNHLLIVILVGVSYLLMDKLPFIFLFLIRGESLEAGQILWSQFLIALLILLPATFAMGGIFPLTVRICSSGLDRVGEDVGSAYSLNTVGAIVGSFLAGFVVIPVLQLQRGHFAAICVNLALAAVLGWLTPWTRRARLAVIGAALILLGAAFFLPRWNLSHISSGLFRIYIARDVLESGRWQDGKLVFYHDGISTTVTVEQWSNEHFSLKNNGKVDASTGDDMSTQIAVGLIPVLLHPRAPDLSAKVALVGLASGVTAGSILQYPVSRLDVVELEPTIISASTFFEHVNHKPLQDKRLRLFTDDGRNFLQAGSESYDVIINEPSNPWITGVSNLFTREYFEIGRRRLSPDGVFCTWAQMYEISPRNIKSIYKTFARVFPYTYAFSAEPLSSDTFLIGTLRPLRLDLGRLRRAFAIPSVGKEMKRARIPSADDLIALTLLGPGEVHSFSLGAEINTDDNALIEFAAPHDLYNHKEYDYFISKVYGQEWLYGRLQDFISGYRTSEDHAGLVRSLLAAGKHREALFFAQQVNPDAGPRSLQSRRLLELLAPRNLTEEEVALEESGPPLTPPIGPKKPLSAEEANRIAREYFVVTQRLKERNHEAALKLIEDWPEDYKEEAGPDFHLLWGYVVYKCRDFHAAVNILEPLGENKAFVQKRPALLYYLGRAFYGNADFVKSIQTLEAWMDRREHDKADVIPVHSEIEDAAPTLLDVLP